MAKLTVSVCAMMSSRAALISRLRSNSDKVVKRCMRESGGRSEVASDVVAEGILILKSDADMDASAVIHSAKKAVGDFDV